MQGTKEEVQQSTSQVSLLLQVSHAYGAGYAPASFCYDVFAFEHLRASLYVSDDNDDTVDVQTVDFPTVLFLDPSLLQHGQVDFLRASSPVPSHVLKLLGTIDEIHSAATNFFGHIHKWMPFISKKRFYEVHLRSSFQSQPDVALLLLCLELITTLPPSKPRNPQTALYHAAKHFYLTVEGSEVLSLPVLQAGVLLALYELGHGIFPAAYLSIGACARYAHALGINTNQNTTGGRRVLTMVEVEERRRVWWAIVIMDRFVSIGCPGRPLATADPSLDDLLPADDALWDQGIVRSEHSIPLASPLTDHMSKFALLCQAARLLGQVLQHASGAAPAHDTVWRQLDRTLNSMLTAALSTDTPDDDQIAFIYSVHVALYPPRLFSPSSAAAGHPVDAERAARGREVMEEITGVVGQNLVERDCFLGRAPAGMSPWGLFFAYRICGYHMRERCRDGAGDRPGLAEIVVERLRGGLRAIDVRWNVAGVYLRLLEAQEALRNP
ncbi:hypothetical protein JX265_001786 [Neoarthrinium moseri]|uniref:Xylanolytic transcriptional activator regulatory domain-containing protein n=1 Tax=Neoarthrinium moseri TaxID=1658444 RepID=A0A9P9WVT6_9PEZI|nr:hypothetical protein JX265_001786 [Neoarthrinium moseri]